MADTAIEWADRVWNPTTGCDRVSPGCDNCYALTMAKRLKGMGSAKYQRDGDPRTSGPGFGLSVHPDTLYLPLRWRKPQRIFVNSMSDLFHDDVPDDFIANMFSIMAQTPRHTFQVLTKRHARMRALLSKPEFRTRVWNPISPHIRGVDYRQWPLPNVWLGVSAENQQWADIRIPALLDTPAAVRFASLEPLLGPIDLDNCGGYQALRPYPDPTLTYLDWVIVGGESGHGARPMHPWWAESLQRQCEAAGVAYLFKQWGEWTPLAPLDAQGRFDFRNGIAMTDDGNTYAPGDLNYPDGPRWGEAVRADFPHHHPTSMYRAGKKRAGRELYHDGRTWDEYPNNVSQEAS